jgi:uncharacterized repeat protein (TIGR01451 family)
VKENMTMPHDKSPSTLLKRLVWVLLLALILGLATVAIVAAQLTLNHSDGTWADATGPSGDPSCLRYGNTPAIGDENTVGYGYIYSSGCPGSSDDPPNFDMQSGFGFTGANALTFDPGEVFLLGEFTHYNRPIYASNAFEQVDLIVDLDFITPTLSTSLTYTMWLTETPNTAPCPYPGSTPCTDKVVFLDTISDEEFEIDGIYYTLQIVGFVPGTSETCNVEDDPINGFITEESQENHACLFGRIMVAEPHILLEKLPNQQTVYSGSDVDFTIRVINDGDVELDNINLTDDKCVPDGPYGDDGDGVLEFSEPWTYTCTVSNATVDFTNVATVTAKVVGDPSNTVTDSDTADVDVINPGISITKEADQTVSFNAPVTFTITVENTGDVDLSNPSVTDPLAPDCEASTSVLTPGQIVTYNCTVDNVTIDFINSATVTATDPLSGLLSDTDTAAVDVLPDITVVKTANPTSVPETGGQVTFSVTVSNNVEETLDLLNLVDDIYGDLNGQGDCATGGPIPVGGGYTCSFTATISGDAPDVHTNTVTATVEDDEHNSAQDSDSASVTLTDVLPDISVTKVASPTSLPEPGGNFTFTLTITNNSVEQVTITALTDTNTLSSECTDLVGDTLAAGASTSCQYTVEHTNAGSYDNTASVTVEDNDGNSASASADETVVVTNVDPVITVEKTATPDSVAEPGGKVTFTVVVTNDSNGQDPVTLTSLIDDIHGDLNGQGDCSVPQTILPGASYTCSFTAQVTGNAGDSETDTITATVQDDEGSEVEESDDATVTITAINVTKTADPEVIHAGDTVVYTYRVVNPSINPISITNVSDDKCTPVTFVDGDTNLDGWLDSGETWVYTCSTEVAEDTTNVVTVEGVDSDGTPVTTQDTAFVDVITPDIQVIKVASMDTILEGESVEWTITVFNRSDTVLYDVTVTDSNGMTFGPLTLDPDDHDDNGGTDQATWSYETSPTADTTNVVTATGTDILNLIVTSQDQASVALTPPPETDSDGDGIPDYLDTDSDGDGISDEDEGDADSDGDGTPDYLDTDSDGDGIPDAVEGTGDVDEDGIPNYLDTDSDGDGIPDAVEGTGDVDEDGIPNYLDTDSDGDGIPDAVEGTGDVDEDGIPNYLDTDSDGDGIPDSVEWNIDADGDGDVDEDDQDVDGDGIPNYLDLDSDGDGIPDSVEWNTDADGDGDVDEDDQDVDGDGIPNYLDLDSDGDGKSDAEEGTGDVDGDGIPNYLDPFDEPEGEDVHFIIYLPLVVMNY